MSDTPNSAEVFILVDPVQDYEESLNILGVYGSAKAARRALPRVRQNLTGRNGYEGDFAPRYLEIQHWRGDVLVHEEKVVG